MRTLVLTSITVLFFACSNKKIADAIYHNGKIYTVDSAFSVQEAFAVKDGKFLAVGSSANILSEYKSEVVTDLAGKPVYPGFYDAHCHFLGYALSLKSVNLLGTKSFDEVLERVKIHAEKNKNAEWITGRGWDQNDWEGKQFPNNKKLDSLFPDKPVVLQRIDGHAALANSMALQLSGINSETKIQGGMVLEGGILIDNAVDLLAIPKPDNAYKTSALIEAQKNCFSVGLTTLDDAGLDLNDIMLIDSLQKINVLDIQVYAMLNPNKTCFEFAKNGIYKTEKLNVRAFKVYADGALGSRGACLKQDYSDHKNHKGFLLNSIDSLKSFAEKINALNFQMNTHCIGDSANKLLLNIYASLLPPKNDKRWRIEHAQVVDEKDRPLFGKYNIIPSVQPTHCTSDMYWAEERLGEHRINFSYAYKSLLTERGLVAAGSDFPVEDINPLYGFYAAITRKDHNDYPQNGFFTNQALSREEALKAMTIWAAYSNFEENEKGSIEKGKKADFVVLDKDIIQINPSEIIKNEVLKTFLNGKLVFEK